MIRHCHLLAALIGRELSGRYRGSALGVLWAFATPLLMLLVYSVVFGEILRVRWTPTAEFGRGEFACVLFSGLLLFNFFSDCVVRAPVLITANVNYVKKVVFPLQVLPLASVGAALVHMLLAAVILLLFEWVTLGRVPSTAPLFLLVMLPVAGYALGISWFLAALGAYLRDIQHVTGIVVNGLIFLSPVFYPQSMIPERWRFLIVLNPLTEPIEQARNVLVYGLPPDPLSSLLGVAAGLTVAALGYAWFRRTRAGFADVL